MTLDTNILIAYLDGEQAVVDFILEQKEIGRAVFISSISITELLSLATLTDTDVKRIKGFLENFISVPFGNELAELAASVRRQYKLSVPDAAVVATALVHLSPLVTRDRGLRKIKEVTFIDL
jgi:predicted nucleic acid-binding protein